MRVGGGRYDYVREGWDLRGVDPAEMMALHRGVEATKGPACFVKLLKGSDYMLLVCIPGKKARPPPSSSSRT